MGRNFFYVYQNKTYHEERAGGFLWSPKYASGNKRNAGYETMKDVVAGDIIFHSYQGDIVAISIAKGHCYDFARPGASFLEWDKSGWRIDTEYFPLLQPFHIAKHIPYLYSIQPSNGPYTSAYRGKQQYLCDVSKEMFDFIIAEIFKVVSPVEKERLANVLAGKIEIKSTATPVVTPSVDHLEIKKVTEIACVEDGCIVHATIQQSGKPTKFSINLEKFPQQKTIIGKTKGETFMLPNIKNVYIIDKILK